MAWEISNDQWKKLANFGGNALSDFGYGLATAPNFGDAFGAAARRGAEQQPVRDAYAQMQEQKAQEQDTRNQTTEWLRQNGHDNLLAAVESGAMTPGDAFKIALQPKAGQDPFTLGAGETRYGPNGEIIAQGAADTKDQFSNEKDLAAQYGSQDPVKTYQTVRNSYERVRSSANMGNNSPNGSGAADISLVFAYMKMLDPTSVVREGEVATANSAGGVPATVLNMYNNLVKGDKLTPDVRGQFVKSADQLYADTAANLEAANSQYSTRAQGWGVNPGNFVITPEQYPAFGANTSDPLGIR